MDWYFFFSCKVLGADWGHNLENDDNEALLLEDHDMDGSVMMILYCTT